MPWRVYRPAIVVGHSETGEMDKIDGPYYFFPLIKRLRDSLPAWLPLVGADLGDTNVVPVDYVAEAMDHIAHLARPRRRGVPPGQPGSAAGRRHDQHLLRGRRRAAGSRRRSTGDRPALLGCSPGPLRPLGARRRA